MPTNLTWILFGLCNSSTITGDIQSENYMEILECAFTFGKAKRIYRYLSFVTWGLRADSYRDLMCHVLSDYYHANDIGLVLVTATSSCVTSPTVCQSRETSAGPVGELQGALGSSVIVRVLSKTANGHKHTQ